MRAGLRVGVVGASGVLGQELIEVLGERRFPVDDLVPVATSRSLGGEVELQGEAYPVLTEIPRLAALDVLFLCAPPGPSLDFAREALREGVPCYDLSGALAGQADVPLLAAELGVGGDALLRPLIATPVGSALALAWVLTPLEGEVGLVRVLATTLEAVSGAGQGGMDSLSREVLAIFNQEDVPDPDVFDRPVAFDCLPSVGEARADGSTEQEEALARDLRRLLGRSGLPVAATAVRVPTFVGHGVSVAVELGRPVAPAEAAALLSKAPGVTVDPEGARGPSPRATTGSDRVLVGRLRRDASTSAGLLLWLVSDTAHLAAANAVKLAELRFERS